MTWERHHQEREGSLRVVVTREADEQEFTADAPDLPGSPLCGRGSTLLAALGSWLLNNQERCGVRVEVPRQPRA